MALDTITIHRPLDMHLHLRDGEMLQLVAPHSANSLAGAVIMPNLVPPVTSLDILQGYEARIKAACGVYAPHFKPLMTLFFRDYSAAELEQAKPHLFAVKLYPHGVTTNSEAGVKSIEQADATFRALEELGIPLLVHGETSGFVMDREAEFLSIYERLATRYPKLKITMEHITTKAAVELLDRYENLSATVTLHHLIITLDDVAGGLLNPHLFCKPIAKRPEDRAALLSAALAGHPKLMLGSDSAPHPRHAKECCGCAAGVYTASVLLPRTVALFEEHHALDHLQAFVSDNARNWHAESLKDLPDRKVTLKKESWTVPATHESADGTIKVVPYEAGKVLEWKVSA